MKEFTKLFREKLKNEREIWSDAYSDSENDSFRERANLAIEIYDGLISALIEIEEGI